MSETTQFDQFSESYDVDLNCGLALTGEDNKYFSAGRIRWLARVLHRLGENPRNLMDYGCGIGTSTQLLLRLLNAKSFVGIDNSSKSLEIARSRYGSRISVFHSVDGYEPAENMDLVYCNGVFHHIAPNERGAAVNFIWECLRPGGILGFWENNAWNPGTRLVMSRVPFDRDAVPLTYTEARRLLQAHGFQVLRTDFLFLFPRALRWLRPLEAVVSKLPLGGQFLVLCRKPYQPNLCS